MRRLIIKWYRGITGISGSRRQKRVIRRRSPRGARTRHCELGDSDNRVLFSIWNRLQADYFADRIDLLSYDVRWSGWHQKRTLASCNVSRRRVVVAPQLSKAELSEWLEPVLYHEMCHAAIGNQVERRGGKRLVHGPQFIELANRHPATQKLTEWLKSGGWAQHNVHLYLR